MRGMNRHECETGNLKKALEYITQRHEEVCADDIRLRRLVHNAVHNAGRLPTERYHRWVYVLCTFGVDRTTAVELCRQHGLDPNEMMGGKDDMNYQEYLDSLRPGTHEIHVHEALAQSQQECHDLRRQLDDALDLLQTWVEDTRVVPTPGLEYNELIRRTADMLRGRGGSDEQ